MKKEWCVWAALNKNLPVLYIDADTFDEAIAEARKTSREYCAAQVSKYYEARAKNKHIKEIKNEV